MDSVTARLHVSPVPPDSGRTHDAARGPISLLAAFESLRSDPYPWLLDSALEDGRLGRFSFAGADPWAVLRARGCELELEVRRAVHPDYAVGSHRRTGDALDWLGALLPHIDGAPEISRLPFVGGAVGWFGYELAEQLEPVHFTASDGPELPDLAFLLVDALLAFDHEAGLLSACGVGHDADPAAAIRAAKARATELACRASRARGARKTLRTCAAPPRRFEARYDADDYAAVVRTVKQGIEAGDLYQACLTHRLDVDFAGDPWPLYRRLRSRNPAPFAAYLALPEATILSSSPERFLRSDPGGAVEARPIKGTHALGRGRASVAESRRALSGSDKDRAENVMIVDLYRNDLGRVCEPGSVRVPELCAIERYATLHQMVSTVTGRLAAGRDRLDLVRAAFPPGSMTGAPKIAAMRLLAALEPARRGPYAGALGYLDLRGGMDLSVVIRTIVVSDGCAHVHVGGGIVADSEPHAEYEESMDKARALLDALDVAPTSRHESPTSQALAQAPRIVPEP